MLLPLTKLKWVLHLGTGTDAAMQGAGDTLVKGDLRGIAKAIRLSRATTWNIRENLFSLFSTKRSVFFWRLGCSTHSSVCCSVL